MDFSAVIIEWYATHKRDLPWRRSADPYIIWLSEVILQQTRVDQGMPYFNKFSKEYPTVASLAAAREDEVLNLWQGLGYYSRGRNMHHTAKVVMEKHNGFFPSSYNDLIQLKGVGPYTAAAISSFAGGEPNAVVDGNVFRLLSRFFGIAAPVDSPGGRKTFTDLANRMMDPNRPGLFNQAIMEFGSLQCRPGKPDCSVCPLSTSCAAYATGKILELPVKSKKAPVKNRFFTYVLAEKNNRILIHKRGAGDIWQHLYEMPLFESAEFQPPEILVSSPAFTGMFGEDVSIERVWPPVKHLLSHQKIIATFILIGNFEDNFTGKKQWFYADKAELNKLAQPKLIFAFLKNYDQFQSYQLQI